MTNHRRRNHPQTRRGAGPSGPPLAFPLVHQPGSKRLMEASASVGDDRDAELLAG